MDKPVSKGKFIVIDGIDGCGSTTIVNELEEYASFIADRKFHLTREPTNGPIGAVIRLAIKERLAIDPKTLALLFAADRLDHVFEKQTGILKYLNEGFDVISDRYVISSYAYQGTEDIELAWLQKINEKAKEPDLTIILDLSVDAALKRKAKDGSWCLELYEKKEKLEEVRQKYLEITKELKAKGHKIFILDGTNDKRTITREIVNLAKKHLDW